MPTPASATDYVDLNFLGRPEIIATAVLHGPSGVALVDPGPSTCLPRLEEGLAARSIDVGDVRQLVLTHIHLDHAGAAGSLVRRNPKIEVLVHEVGAPHLVDPSRLIASAARLYGTEMERLWGEILPVPKSSIRVVGDGDRIVAGPALEVAYTPGHASHHVSYFDAAAGVAFVGDTAGIRRGGSSYVMPPTPPPDIDLAAWRSSADRILAWRPSALFLTHFGRYDEPHSHLQAMFERLSTWSVVARRLLADQSIDERTRQHRFTEEVLSEMRQTVGDEQAQQYNRAGRLEYSWQGLARYWRKRMGSAGAAAKSDHVGRRA